VIRDIRYEFVQLASDFGEYGRVLFSLSGSGSMAAIM
jgi:hypothetical protein